MSIENSFCRCDWKNTVQLWNNSDTEDDFAEEFFSTESTEEITFPEKVAYHIVSWDLLEDFGDWYRDRSFTESPDWENFCAAWKQLGLMETEPYIFGPVNELIDEEEAEVVFGALPPESVQKVLAHLEKIDGKALDTFIRKHELAMTVPFSEQVTAMREALHPEKGLVIFAG